MRYFIKLGYRGKSFHGWQSQPNALGVQQVVEQALSTVFRVDTPIVGAGRTDAGVNARRMTAHFDADVDLHHLQSLLPSLNRLVGPDIAIYDVSAVLPDAHARFDAISRRYKYFITYRKDPFKKELAWFTHRTLDLAAMNIAAGRLLRVNDFTSFAKLHSDTKTNICKVMEAVWTPISEDGEIVGLVFSITADRFLRNMVRAVVGTLVEVGRGKLSLEDFAKVIDAQDRSAAGTSMPGEALFLWNVAYPKEIFL